MNINMNMSFMLGARNNPLKIAIPVIKNQVPPLQVSNNSVSTVTISDAARHAATLNPKDDKNTITPELRDLVMQYDLHSITPRQMGNLGSELLKRGEISQEAAASFVSVEMNTVVARDPDKPIDMVAHFQRMLNSVEIEARSDSTFGYAVYYRKQASQALSDVLSFADSGRSHISG